MHTDIYERILIIYRMHTNIYEWKLTSMGTYRHLWVHTDICGCTQTSMSAYRYLWVHTTIYGCILIMRFNCRSNFHINILYDHILQLFLNWYFCLINFTTIQIQVLIFILQMEYQQFHLYLQWIYFLRFILIIYYLY